MRKNKFLILLFIILVSVVFSDNVYANPACNGSEYACAVCKYSYGSFTFTYTVKSDGYNISSGFSVENGTYDSTSGIWTVDGYKLKNSVSDNITFVDGNKIRCADAIVVDDKIVSEKSMILYGANAGTSCSDTSCVWDVTLEEQYNNGKEVISSEMTNNIKSCSIQVQNSSENGTYDKCKVDFNTKTNTIVSVRCGEGNDYSVDSKNAVEVIGNGDFATSCPTNKKYSNVKLVCDISAKTCKFEKIKDSAYPPGFDGSNNSNGSCCMYKSDMNEYVYFYTLTNPKNNNVKFPALCYGLNCITNNFSGNNTQLVNLQNQPNWRTYFEKIDNCSKLPYHIWFKNVDGKTEFYSEWVLGATKATLNTSETCVSNLTFDPNSESGDGSINWGDQVEVNCEGIIGDELLGFINKIFRWIQIIAPIIVILLSGIDFASAVLQDDRDALKKASTKLIKRLIIAVALFLIPVILSFVLEIFNEISINDTGVCI